MRADHLWYRERFLPASAVFGSFEILMEETHALLSEEIEHFSVYRRKWRVFQIVADVPSLPFWHNSTYKHRCCGSERNHAALQCWLLRRYVRSV
jgi:hypothetical protein